jgi:hypothetical protein
MRVFLIACAATLILAVGGLFALASVQKPAGVAYVGDGARISPKWSWRQVVSRPKEAPQNVSMVVPQPSEPLSEDCNTFSAWAWIMADFQQSATADGTCDH